MDKTQQIDETKAPAKKDVWFERVVLLLVFAVFIPGMIYLNANGTDTGEVFSKVAGLIVIGSLFVAVIAFAIAIFNRLIGFLAGKK